MTSWTNSTGYLQLRNTVGTCLSLKNASMQHATLTDTKGYGPAWSIKRSVKETNHTTIVQNSYEPIRFLQTSQKRLVNINCKSQNHTNPRPTKEGWGWLVIPPPPPTVCLRPHKNAKESDPGHLGHLFYILCGHFHEKKKKTEVPPKMRVGWAVKARR